MVFLDGIYGISGIGVRAIQWAAAERPLPLGGGGGVDFLPGAGEGVGHEKREGDEREGERDLKGVVRELGALLELARNEGAEAVAFVGAGAPGSGGDLTAGGAVGTPIFWRGSRRRAGRRGAGGYFFFFAL